MLVLIHVQTKMEFKTVISQHNLSAK